MSGDDWVLQLGPQHIDSENDKEHHAQLDYWLRKWPGPNQPLRERNPNGHVYGCDCSECIDFYRSLK